MSDSGKAQAYRWEDLPREHVRPGVSRAGFRGNDVMLCMNWLEPGTEVRPHNHPPISYTQLTPTTIAPE